jgi:ATP-binding cassette subfamily B (MDR/TAP) protein 1
MQDGIGEKMGIFVYLLTTFIISVIMSFIHGWKLTLVILCCAPVMIFAQAIVAKVIMKFRNLYILLSSMLLMVFFAL